MAKIGQPLKMVYPAKESHVFQSRDFIAGHRAIDFINTVTGRNGTPRDWLADPTALTGWAAQAGIATELEAEQLARLYQARPKAGAAALAKAVELREAMYVLLDATRTAVAPPVESLAMIEKAWLAAALAAGVCWDDAEGLSVSISEVSAATVVDRIALEFVALGAELISPRLRRCAGSNCGWFFIDTSKAGRRRWCDMATCGNAAKYVRYRV